MFAQCIDAEADWYYETLFRKEDWVAETPHSCSECGGFIPAGQQHYCFVGRRPDRPKNVDMPGQVDEFHTCPTCIRIWDSLAGGTYAFEQLDELAYDAFGVGLTDVPEDDSEQDWEQMRDLVSLPVNEVIALKPKNDPEGVWKFMLALVLLSDFLTDEQRLQVFETATRGASR